MKASLALALAGSLILATPFAAVADDAKTSPPQQSGSDFSAKKDAYVKDMHGQMDEWGHKIDDYSRDAKAKGRQAGTAADRELHNAWLQTQAASRRVAHAGAKGWDKAKTAFERASDRLKRDWDKHTSQ